MGMRVNVVLSQCTDKANMICRLLQSPFC